MKKSSALTRLQGSIAIASFSTGVLIACVCLFFVPPYGEISNSAISIVSEMLVLAGAILSALGSTPLLAFSALGFAVTAALMLRSPAIREI